MATDHDRSDKDKMYFIDGSVYNCPFCKRGHVSYIVSDSGSFDRSNTKTVYYYLVRCEDCDKSSFHLSEYNLDMESWGHNRQKFIFPPKQIKRKITAGSPIETVKSDVIDKEGKIITELDDVFFYNEPTEFFTIDERIPHSIRKPFNEANNCLKSNFVTGSSAGLRKAIYKLLKHEGIRELNQAGDFLAHDSRIDLLKEKYHKIEPELLDELKAVHMLTSQELHENDWEDFDGPTLRFLIGATKEILTEIYVTPDEARRRRETLAELKKNAKPLKDTQKDRKPKS